MHPLKVKATTGRPRKTGARTPSGQLSRARSAIAALQDAERGTVFAQRRRLGATDRNVKDSRWSTPWGRLYLTKQIPLAEYRAAERWAGLLGRVRKIIDARAPYASAMDMMRGRVGRHEQPEEDEETIERNQEALDAHRDAMLQLERHGAQAEALARLCGQQLDPTPAEIAAVRRCLARLAFHFDLAKHPEPAPLDL